MIAPNVWRIIYIALPISRFIPFCCVEHAKADVINYTKENTN